MASHLTSITCRTSAGLRWHLLLRNVEASHAVISSRVRSCILFCSQDDVQIGLEVTMQPATLEAGGRLVIRSVEVGAGCSLGTRSYVQGGCNLPPGSSYPPLTVLTPASLAKQHPAPADIECGRDQVEQAAPSNEKLHGLPGLKTAAAVLLMLLEGYAYAPLLFAIVSLLETLNGISSVVLSTTGEGGWSWTGIVFWLTLLPMGQLLLPETYYILALLLKHLVLGAPRIGPDGLPLMHSTWDKLRHFCMVRVSS